MIKRYEPGENVFYAGGGFEVRDSGGGTRHYDLDQVIIHPAIIKHRATLDLMSRKVEKDAAAVERAFVRGEKAPRVKVEGGRRGRPSVDPEIKAARALEKEARVERSGGKRGRPASGTTKAPAEKSASGGKKGRPSLSSEVVARRATERAAHTVRTGGKRGRPSSKRR